MNPGISATDLLRSLSSDLAGIGRQSPDDVADQIGVVALTLNYIADALDHEFRLAAQRGRNMNGLPQPSKHE